VDDVEGISVQEPLRRPVFTQVASWRRLLKVRTLSGEQLFVLSSVRAAAEELRQLLGVAA
jgi:hypothetical protein